MQAGMHSKAGRPADKAGRQGTACGQGKARGRARQGGAGKDMKARYGKAGKQAGLCRHAGRVMQAFTGRQGKAKQGSVTGRQAWQVRQAGNGMQALHAGQGRQVCRQCMAVSEGGQGRQEGQGKVAG
jgi:hypothetical protein